MNDPALSCRSSKVDPMGLESPGTAVKDDSGNCQNYRWPRHGLASKVPYLCNWAFSASSAEVFAGGGLGV